MQNRTSKNLQKLALAGVGGFAGSRNLKLGVQGCEEEGRAKNAVSGIKPGFSDKTNCHPKIRRHQNALISILDVEPAIGCILGVFI